MSRRKELFEFKARGAAMIKGKSAPIETYEVLAPKAVPGKVRGLEGLASPLVWRAAEFQLVNDKLNEVRQRRGAFVPVIGEAGLGKSRLLAEVSNAAVRLSARQSARKKATRPRSCARDCIVIRLAPR